MKSISFTLKTLSILAAFVFIAGCAGAMKNAKDLAAKGDYQGAIAAYQQTIQAEPNSSDARKAQLAIAALYIDKMNKPKEGLDTYQKVVEDAPQSEEAAEALYRTGIHYFKTEDYKNAEEMFTRIVNDFPQSSRGQDAQLLLAKTYEKANEYNRAVEVYDAVVKRAPESKRAVQAMLNKGKLYQDKVKDQGKAVELYQDIVKNYGMEVDVQDQVNEAKKELKSLGAEIPKPVNKLATPEARRAARRAARREINRPRGSSARQSTTRKETARSQSFGVDPEIIMQSIQISLDSQGTYYDAMFMVANMKFGEENYREAGALYERAIQLGLKDPIAYRNLAECYRKIGLANKAREVLKRGMTKDPKMLDSIIESGEAQYQFENYDAALELYESILGLSKGKDSKLYHHIGLVYKKLKDTDKEIEAYERSIAINPNNQEVLQLMAEALYYRKGNRTKAGIYQDAADGKVNSYDVQKELGDVCYKYGNYNWAKTKYETAVRILERQIKKPEGEKTELEKQKEATTDLTEKAKLRKEIDKLQREIDDLSWKILLMKVKTALAIAHKESVDAGKQQMDELAAQNPDHAIIHYGLGEFALMQGDTETAIAEFQKSIEIENFLEPNLALGEYYISQGNKEEALKLWEAYTKKNYRDRTMRSRVKALQQELHPEEAPKSKAPTPTLKGSQ
ncbi:MAG: tetratricopeptide repeat protein [Candidatus Poribacteria bacterium]